MRRVIAIAMVLEGSLTGGLCGQGTDFPPALPRAGATMTSSNPLIDVWDVTWVVGASTGMHRHLLDNFGVELTRSRTLLTDLGGSTRTASLDPGRIWFQGKGVTHAESLLTDNPPRRAIIVELRDSMLAVLPNHTSYPTGPVDAGLAPTIDNARVSLWRVTWTSDRAEPMRFYSQPVVIIFVTDAQVEWIEADGARSPRSHKSGDVLFLPAGQARAPRSVRGTAEVVVAVLKGIGEGR